MAAEARARMAAVVMALLVGMFHAASARAQVPAPAPAPAEPGKFYLRLDGGVDLPNNLHFQDRNPSSPTAFLQGGETAGDTNSTGFFGGGIGYQIAPVLRGDLTVSYHPSIGYTGRNTITGQQTMTKIESTVGMATLYLHAPRPVSMFEPFFGFGAGFAYDRVASLRNTNAGFSSTTPGGSVGSAAFSVSLGAGIRITQTIVLDIAYRYLAIQRLETSSGTGVTRSGSTFPIDGVKAVLNEQAILTSIRYRF